MANFDRRQMAGFHCPNHEMDESLYSNHDSYSEMYWYVFEQ